jgi:hypothetical protein
MIVSLISLAIAIACRSISELQQHHKLRWQNEANNYFSFWGRNSWVRKYKRESGNTAIFKLPTAWKWYYKIIGSKYKERWFTSTWLTVAFTDGYHLMQFIYNIFLSLAVALLIDISYFIWIWIGVVLVHALVYRIAQK